MQWFANYNCERQMPFDPDLIPLAVARYRRERDRYVKLADRVAEICREDVCEQNAIRAQVTFRVKSEKSFEAKLKRFSNDPDRNYEAVDDIFTDISDLAGVRISAYQEQDCEQIVARLGGVFRGPRDQDDIQVDRKDKKTPENENYYRAIHAQVSLIDDQLVGTYDNVGDISCEIQVCTMIAHVWNEIEHDIGYKTEFGGPSGDEKYHLAQLGGLVRQGDLIITALVDAHEHRVSSKPEGEGADNSDQKFVDVHEFVSRMRRFAGGATPKFSENSGQLFELLIDLDVASPMSLSQKLEDFDLGSTQEKIDQFNSHLTETGAEGLSVDRDTSDLLLIALLDRMPDEISETLKGRAGRGKGRPSRLHRIAARYRDWQLK